MEDMDFHKKMAVDLFNGVWDLLDKKDRTDEDNQTMINAAHASCYHWSKVGTPINAVRGDWQISRVYSVLGRSEPALYHGQRCLNECQKHGIGDFDLAFAFEAVARAQAVAGNTAERDKYVQLANEAGEAIAEKDDKDYFFSELGTIL